MASSQANVEQRTSSSTNFLFKALSSIAFDATRRIYVVFGAILSLPVVAGVPTPAPGYPNLVSAKPDYKDYTLNSSIEPSVLADSVYFQDRNVGYSQWAARANKIRNVGSPVYCAGNLSLALSEVGAAYAASAQGSTSLLTLLPTAGALIGAPAKELWVLFKLVPLAGFFAGILSLGGSIVPHQVSEYASLEDFSYSGMRDTNAVDGMIKRRPSGRTWAEDPEPDLHQTAEHFADQVRTRAMDSRGSAKRWKVILGMFALICCILLICGACYILSAGSIVVWWCTAKNWAFAWYSFTIFATFCENYTNAPFAKDWVFRVSRAPNLRISSDAPWVVTPDQSTTEPSSEDTYRAHTSKSDDAAVMQSLLFGAAAPSPSVLDALNKGFNTEGRVIMDPNEPWSASKDAFYVIISRAGIGRQYTFFRLMSKLVSVATFVISTSLFASSTLLQLQPAIIIMTLVLCAGIFGRVTAMWISALIMRDRPVLHRVVKTKKEADVFIEAILRKEGLVFEVLGHIVINGRCVKRQGRFTWSTILGVLAKPFDVSGIAVASSA